MLGGPGDNCARKFLTTPTFIQTTHIWHQRGICDGFLAVEQAVNQTEHTLKLFLKFYVMIDSQAYACADLSVDRLYLGLSGHLVSLIVWGAP